VTLRFACPPHSEHLLALLARRGARGGREPGHRAGASSARHAPPEAGGRPERRWRGRRPSIDCSAIWRTLDRYRALALGLRGR
jgi:hypothetical protein